MAKAILHEDEGAAALDHEAMVLMVPGCLWNVLVKQAKAEGTTPGAVFSTAVKEYLEKRGSQEAVEYLWSLTR